MAGMSGRDRARKAAPAGRDSTLRTSANVAVRAEPLTVGTGRARDPLALEVRLLGSLLGQVIAEQAGRDLLDLVERIRRAAIRLRRDDDATDRDALATELAGLDVERAEVVIRAFSLYFRLVNLAEERDRVRAARRRERSGRDRPEQDSIVGTLADLRAGRAPGELDEVLGRLRISPVLTAHPTEARRRTLLLALRRVERILGRLDDRDLPTPEDRDLRRRLREEITLLWRTADLRIVAPTPLDEVRTALAFFDETLFGVVPRLYRLADSALDGTAAGGEASDADSTGTRPPRVAAFLRWGSWIGGDRDGNPAVTAEVTEGALRIHADHVLRGYEAVTRRLAQTVAASVEPDRVGRPLVTRLARDADLLPELDRQMRRRFPDEPYRQRFGFMAERLRRTRAFLTGQQAPLTGRYESAAELDAELGEIQETLVAEGLGRIAWGEVQDLRWQLATFGFHLAGLEMRQHSAVHRTTLAAMAANPASVAGGSSGAEATPGVTVAEVVETLRASATIQARFGEAAMQRYIISFTAGPADVQAVFDLAAAAGIVGSDGRLALDIVPLFEDAATLDTAGEVLDAILSEPAYREHVRRRGDRQEVMLGYSDSNKESGYLAANWLIHRAQASLAAAARQHSVELTLFHGRGGAIGRGGGPANRAILGLAPGALDGRLKLTEQGEVIAENYADPGIAIRHLDRLTAAVVRASTASHTAALETAEISGGPILDELAETSREVYRTLVLDDPGFIDFFRLVTPIDEIATLRLGSRPAARGRGGGRSAAESPPRIADLRAIPWVFAWAQARIDLPGWFGLGSALEAFGRRRGDAGLRELARLYRTWPFLASLIDNAELALARADIGVARQYAALAPGDDHAHRWATIEAEHRRTVAWLARLTGRTQLLEDEPELRRRIGLRDPYVDSLSAMQVMLLARLRACKPADPERDRLLRLVQLTVNGIAAGLQATG
jgi:phosphoenolpyruvate carboxylase